MFVIKPGNVQAAEHVRSIHHIVVNPETRLADLLEPAAWGALTGTVKTGDRVEVAWEDGSAYADLVVRDVGASWAKVGVHHHSQHAAAEDLSDWSRAFSVKKRANGYFVLRKDDEAQAAGPFDHEGEAEQVALAMYRR